MMVRIAPRDGDRSTELTRRLAAMRAKEASAAYAVPDYLSGDGRRRSAVDGGDAGPPMAPSASARSAAVVSPAPGDGGDGSPASSSSPTMTEAWREKICEWYYDVVDHYGEEGTPRCMV